jgi:hypothetical protein
MPRSPWCLVRNPQTLDHYAWKSERLSERKRFLFMAAIGRHIATLMTEPECIRVVEACEELAEGIIDSDTFCDLHSEAQGASERSEAPAIGQAANNYVYLIADDDKHNECIWCALDALGYVAATKAGLLNPSATPKGGETVWDHPVFLEGKKDAERTFLGYMHDVFGPNPFKPVKFDPAWRTEAVVALARSMYDSRDFSAMPVLADALQDAGCETPAIIEHCQDVHAVHVRGCWVVDAILRQ